MLLFISELAQQLAFSPLTQETLSQGNFCNWQYDGNSFSQRSSFCRCSIYCFSFQHFGKMNSFSLTKFFSCQIQALFAENCQHFTCSHKLRIAFRWSFGLSYISRFSGNIFIISLSFFIFFNPFHAKLFIIISFSLIFQIAIIIIINYQQLK